MAGRRRGRGRGNKHGPPASQFSRFATLPTIRHSLAGYDDATTNAGVPAQQEPPPPPRRSLRQREPGPSRLGKTSYLSKLLYQHGGAAPLPGIGGQSSTSRISNLAKTDSHSSPAPPPPTITRTGFAGSHVLAARRRPAPPTSSGAPASAPAPPTLYLDASLSHAAQRDLLYLVPATDEANDNITVLQAHVKALVPLDLNGVRLVAEDVAPISPLSHIPAVGIQCSYDGSASGDAGNTGDDDGDSSVPPDSPLPWNLARLSMLEDEAVARGDFGPLHHLGSLTADYLAEDDEGQHDELCASSCVMQLAEQLEVDGLTLIKRDETKVFAFADSARGALYAGMAVAQMSREVTAKYKRYRINTSFGIGMGKALIMPGDLFGDCVNVASKLGEDTCKAGEIMVDRKTFASIPAEDVWALQDAGFTTTPHTVQISAVTIEAEEIRATRATAIPDFLQAVGMAMPHVSSLRGGLGDVHELMVQRSNVSDDDTARMALDREIDERLAITGTVFNSDMSGFTRITKKHGILHFLAMILKMRSIVRPIIASCGGQILHYDGDNVIAVFPTPQDGVDGALKVLRALREYNSGHETDTKLLLKIGLAHGVMHDTGKQLFGDTWETCELLGEELGGKRQLLVTSAIAKVVDLSEHSDIIESIGVQPYPEGEKPESEGDTYTLIQTKTEVDEAARQSMLSLSVDNEALTACARLHSEPLKLAEGPSLAATSVRNERSFNRVNRAPSQPHRPSATEVDTLLLQTFEKGANIDDIHARVRERYNREGFALIVKLHATEDDPATEPGGEGGDILTPLAQPHANPEWSPTLHRRSSTISGRKCAAVRRVPTNTLR